MNKEFYVSSTPHETNVALMEDDQLAEVFFERENEYTLAGSIYKGRVTRVLPGHAVGFRRYWPGARCLSVRLRFPGTDDEEDKEEFGDIPAPRGTVESQPAATE